MLAKASPPPSHEQQLEEEQLPLESFVLANDSARFEINNNDPISSLKNLLIVSSQSLDSVNKDRTLRWTNLHEAFKIPVLRNPLKADRREFCLHHRKEYIASTSSLSESQSKKRRKLGKFGREQNDEELKVLAEFGLVDDCYLPTRSQGHSFPIRSNSRYGLEDINVKLNDAKHQLKEEEEGGGEEESQNMKEYFEDVVGGTLFATRKLIAGLLQEKEREGEGVQVACHWDGGRHHAKRDFATGFCYINDCVLSLLALTAPIMEYNEEGEAGGLERVLYIDIDVHHGDGVQEAFEYTKKVTTVDFHLLEKGYFPGTGNIEEIGIGKGLYHTVNIPLPRTTSSSTFLHLFQTIIPKILQKLQPEAVVMQCGCDGLAGDPLGGWKLEASTISECCRFLVSQVKHAPKDVPILFLGGGGYDSLNAARCWTLCSLSIQDELLGDDVKRGEEYVIGGEDGIPLVPLECVDWPLYAPDYSLQVSAPSHTISCKIPEDLDEEVTKVLEQVSSNIEKINILE